MFAVGITRISMEFHCTEHDIKLCWTLEACQQIIYKVLDESHYATVVKHDFGKLLAAGFIRLVEQA
jgi:hypothetical protein